MNTPSNRILDFYSNKLPNGSGKYLSDMMRFEDEELETYHDYIQWVFPLKEHSRVDWSAPVLDEATIQAFKAQPEFREKLLAIFQKMLSFYGFEINSTDAGKLEIVKSKDFAEKSTIWFHRNNHNHLRITRILTSMALLGLENYSRAFLACLETVDQEFPGHITPESMRYWKETHRIGGT